MDKSLCEAAREALATTDWSRIDRRAARMTPARFARVHEFSIRTIQERERGPKRPSGPARTLSRAIKGDAEGIRRTLPAA